MECVILPLLNANLFKDNREAIGEKQNEIGGASEKGFESTEEVITSNRVGTSGNDGRVKKDRANWKMKAKTRTWFDVVKGLKDEGNESEAIASVEQFDS